MLFLTRGRWRTAATAMTAGALAATTLAFAGAPAQAADTQAAGTLEWGISQYVDEHLLGQSFTDGATSSDGVVTFIGGAGVIDANSGTAELHYQGSARYAFLNPSTSAELYSYEFVDPTVTIDADGEGAISADFVFTAPGVPEGEPVRVDLVTFDAQEAIKETVVDAVPRWLGVLAPDTQASLDAGITGAGQPVDGASWAPELITLLPKSLKGTFYASGSASDAKKAPAAFSATAPAPVPAVTASAAVNGDYVDVSIEGSNFDVQSRPDALGVYAAFGPKQNIFAVEAEGEEDGAAAFLTSDWVMPNQFSDGAWTKTLAVEKAKLKKGVEYAVYTWTAHGNPIKGDSQYTETIVKVPGLPKNNSKTVIKLKKKPTTKKKGNARIIVKGVAGVKASGKVKITLKKGKQTKKFTRKLNKKGKASVKLPKLKKGKWKLVAKYTADKNFKKSKTVVKFKVKK